VTGPFAGFTVNLSIIKSTGWAVLGSWVMTTSLMFLSPGVAGRMTDNSDGLAAATLVTGVNSEQSLLGPFVYGTDGTGAPNLIVPAGGLRQPIVPNATLTEDADGNKRTINNLFMNGPEIFTFTLRVVPKVVSDLIRDSAINPDSIDFYVFHQANQYMLEHLRKKLAIPSEKFGISMKNCGNTVSSTIPIALSDLGREGKLRPGNTIMLVGFGVGYSWGATLARWIE